MARANLEAKLSADTSVFTRAMAAAQLQTRQWAADVTNRVGIVGGSLDKVAKASRNLQGQLIALVGIGTLSRVASEIDEMGDAAAQLEVSANFMSAFGQAARIATSDASTAEGALRKLLQVIGDARAGEPGATDIFGRLGIDPNRFRDNEQLIYAIARALGNVETNAKRASLAADLFGKTGVRLVELFKGGEAGFAELIRQVEAGNLAIADSTSALVGAAIGEWETLWQRFKVRAGEGVAGIQAANVAMRSFSKDLNSVFLEGVERQKEFTQGNFSGLGFNALRDRVVRVWEDIKASVERASEAIDEAAKPPDIPIAPSVRQPALGGGGTGFAAPFLFEAFRAVLPQILEQGAAARFRDLSRSFPGIPLSGAGQGTLEVWEAQRRLENELVESKGRRAEREGNPPPGGSIRLDTDTQLMLQELRRNSKQLEKIEQNTAPLRE